MKTYCFIPLKYPTMSCANQNVSMIDVYKTHKLYHIIHALSVTYSRSVFVARPRQKSASHVCMTTNRTIQDIARLGYHPFFLSLEVALPDNFPAWHQSGQDAKLVIEFHIHRSSKHSQLDTVSSGQWLFFASICYCFEHCMSKWSRNPWKKEDHFYLQSTMYLFHGLQTYTAYELVRSSLEAEKWAGQGSTCQQLENLPRVGRSKKKLHHFST